MKVRKLSVIFALLGVILASGFLTAEVQAADEEPITPGESCHEMIKILQESKIDMGSFWEEDLNECWLRTSVEGSTCYPGYEVYYPVYFFVGLDLFWTWESYGCVARYNRPNDFFKDPSMGFHVLNNGPGTFEYEWRTCAYLCRINAHGLTERATELLEEAPGRILEKTYLQIFDEFGKAGFGDFTFCLPAKGAKMPTYFRLGAGNQWVQIIGGHWDINMYCMQGEMSGNYILVDMYYKSQ